MSGFVYRVIRSLTDILIHMCHGGNELLFAWLKYDLCFQKKTRFCAVYFLLMMWKQNLLRKLPFVYMMFYYISFVKAFIIIIIIRFLSWYDCLLICKQSEEERLKDQREKEELEQHMRERDAAGTRKVLVNVQIDLVRWLGHFSLMIISTIIVVVG